MQAAGALVRGGDPGKAGAGVAREALAQGQGDFLIRGVLGVDGESGAMVVGEDIEVGQTVRFHVRDAASADADLRRTLQREAAALGGEPPAGALLFSCNGRGTRMFAEPDHDIRQLLTAFGDIPVAGFSCAGELGPVGERNFLHTFTAVYRGFPRDGLNNGSWHRHGNRAGPGDPRAAAVQPRTAR